MHLKYGLLQLTGVKNYARQLRMLEHEVVPAFACGWLGVEHRPLPHGRSEDSQSTGNPVSDRDGPEGCSAVTSFVQIAFLSLYATFKIPVRPAMAR